MNINRNKLDLSTMKTGDMWTIVTTSSPHRVSVKDENSNTRVQIGIRVCGQYTIDGTDDSMLDLTELVPDRTIRVIRMSDEYWEIFEEPSPFRSPTTTKWFFKHLFGKG